MAEIESNINNSIADYIETMSLDTDGTLKSIDLTLKAIARQDGLRISQSSLKDLAEIERRSNIYNRATRDSAANTDSTNQQNGGYRRTSSTNDNYFDFDRRQGRVKADKMFDKLVDDFEDTLAEALFGSKHPFQTAANNIADQLVKSAVSSFGSVDNIGEGLAKGLLNALDKIPYQSIIGNRTTTLGKEIEAELNSIKTYANRFIDKGINAVSQTLFGVNVPGGTDWFSTFSKRQQAKDESRRATEQPQVKDITNFKEDVNTGFDDVVQAIYTSNGRFGSPQPGNEFDDIGDQIGDIVGIPYREITGQGQLGNADLTDVVDTVGDIADVVDIAGKLPGTVGDVAGLADAATGAATSCTELAATSTALSTEVTATGTELATIGGEMAVAGEGAATLGLVAPELLAAVIGVSIALDALSDATAPAMQGLSDFISGITNAFNRQQTLNSKYLELQKKRNEQDIKAIREAAYKVIQDSAERVEQVWDSIETTVAATQLTDKAGVQDLWSEYASRLKEEGLASVVSSADIMEKLPSVLQQGLSGKVAEEFAYQATLLNSAVPTQDFFQYAETYASIAANAIRNGADQEKAIATANEELIAFADNLLHASRVTAQGFSTSLQNGADLFKRSAEIALASRVGDVSDISRLLTTVSGAVGAIAPDLASGIIDAVYNAATGGNSADITALRSLAGTGASNTAFLQALAKDPQNVFSTLFKNLAQLQQMSADNYMEVAEALSGVFGISRDSFARVDFEYLAEAIDNMNETDGDLSQNMELLAKGQTTSNDSQMRMQKINEYMIEEGLAYVLDNQVARSIQEHMWEEQLARELEEANYSVDFVGGALSLIQGIANTVINITDLINPAGWVKKVGNVVLTAIEASEQDKDLKKIVEAGKVGEGNEAMFHALTTQNENLKLATPILELLGQKSGTATVQNLLDLNNTLFTNRLANNAAHISTTDLFSGTKSAAATITSGSPLGAAVSGVASAASGVGSVVSGAASMASSALSGITSSVSEIVEGAGSVVDSVLSTASSAASSITGAVSSAGTALKNAGSALLSKGKTALSNFFSNTTIGKTIASVINSGDWRTGGGFNAIWGTGADDWGTPTQDVANELSDLISTSIQDYVKASQETSTRIDNERMRITSDLNNSLIERDAQILAAQGYIQNRGFLSNAEVVDMVTASYNEVAEAQEERSFDAWLAAFQEEYGIKDLSSMLSDYGETISTVQAMYQQEQAARENALTKARDLHEVQFWEDMQQFATVDFPWYMREWERYYIQHEAYTEASNNAYEEAINLAVAEKGEMGDSVLALAEALIDNNMWQEELGDKIKDPVLHTNVLLSKILLVVEAIMQQNNETSIVSVPTALSSLGLGISNS